MNPFLVVLPESVRQSVANQNAQQVALHIDIDTDNVDNVGSGDTRHHGRISRIPGNK